MNTLTLQLFLLLNVFCIGVIATLALQHARAHVKTKGQKLALPEESKARLAAQADAAFSTVIDKATRQLEHDLSATSGRVTDTLEKIVASSIEAEMKQYRANLRELHQQNEAALKQSLTDTTEQHLELKNKLLKRQAELDESLMHYQNELETDLAVHQSDLEKKLEARQTELDEALTSQQYAYATHQAELEAKLKQHHQELTAALSDRETQLQQNQKELETELLAYQTKYAQLQQSMESKLDAEITAKKDFMSKQIDTKLADAVSSLLVESLGHNVDLGAQTSYLTALLEEHKAELAKGVRDEL